MKKNTRFLFIILSYSLLMLSSAYATVVDTKLSTVAPIINQSCLACHSGPPNSRLDYPTTLGWINSSFVVPGDSAKSRLITVFSTNVPAAMKSIKLTTKDLTALKTWIDQIKVTCSAANSKINYEKVDGCSCPAEFDEIRSPDGSLTECRKPVEVATCSVQFSLVNPTKPDGCSCVNNYTEQRDSNKKLTSCTAPATALSSDTELRRYSRCYGHLTRGVISDTDPRIALIKSKKMTGAQACMELLEKATLNSTGVINKNSSGKNDVEGMQILSTFQKFHMSWFTNLNLSLAASDLPSWYTGTYELFYAGESALLMTNALFNKTVPYSTIVTSKTALQAVRENTTKGVFSVTPTKQHAHFNDNYEDIIWKPTGILKTGNMIGISTIKADYIPFAYDIPDYKNIEYKLPSGGGVLGSNPYFLLNQGQGFFAESDGGVVAYRRWSKQIFKDVLCREVPVIRSSDVVFLKQKMPPSKISFRNGNACLQCHFSMDGLAGSIRNKALAKSGIGGQEPAYTLLTYQHPITATAVTDLEKLDHDPKFHNRPPTANLVFRTFDGEFINKQVTGTQELGESISELDDLYTCAASRYFRFFTGVNVQMRDFNDPSSTYNDSADEIQYRNLVLKLGKDLKKHQSLNKLIEDIISSPQYITPGKIN